MRNLILILILMLATPALAEEPIPGPLKAEVLRVYDGDTFTARVHIWPGLVAETGVRVVGVDTPELRAKCTDERQGAVAAKEFVKQLIELGEVELKEVRYEKYAKRVAAIVEISGENLAENLIQHGLGRPYDGGTRDGWCGTEG